MTGSRSIVRAITILLVCSAALILLPFSVVKGGTYEHARAVGKRCATCHDTVRPDANNLNPTGRFFLINRRLPRDGERTDAALKAADDGATIYARACARCHGPFGEGTPLAPALTGALKQGDTSGQLRTIVRRGVPGTAMAAFAGTLSDEQIERVVEHIMELRKKPSRP